MSLFGLGAAVFAGGAALTALVVYLFKRRDRPTVPAPGPQPDQLLPNVVRNPLFRDPAFGNPAHNEEPPYHDLRTFVGHNAQEAPFEYSADERTYDAMTFAENTAQGQPSKGNFVELPMSLVTERPQGQQDSQS
jgi:hypothetical protein